MRYAMITLIRIGLLVEWKSDNVNTITSFRKYDKIYSSY